MKYDQACQNLSRLLSHAEGVALRVIERDGTTDSAIIETVPRLKSYKLVELTDEISGGRRWVTLTRRGRKVAQCLGAL